MFVPGLQDFPRYKLLTRITLYPELNLVVPLTVRNTVFADVFSTQHPSADFALETAEVPVAPQRHQGLAILDVSPTAIAVIRLFDAIRSGRHGFNAALTEAVFSTEGDTIPSWKGLFANCAHKAGRVVGLPQDCDHFSLHKSPTVVAGSAMEPLEVQWTEVVAVLREETRLSQVAAAHFARKALYVEVAGLDS